MTAFAATRTSCFSEPICAKSHNTTVATSALTADCRHTHGVDINAVLYARSALVNFVA